MKTPYQRHSSNDQKDRQLERDLERKEAPWDISKRRDSTLHGEWPYVTIARDLATPLVTATYKRGASVEDHI